MNEITELWNEHPAWGWVFNGEDRLVIEYLLRQTAPRVIPSTKDAPWIESLLLLAKAIRLEHVSLSLDNDELDALIGEQLWTSSIGGGPDAEISTTRPSATTIRESLVTPPEPWSALVQFVELDQPLDNDGPPIVLSTRHGVAAYASWRRHSHAESLVAMALHASSTRVASNSVLSSIPTDELVEALGAPRQSESEPSVRAVANALARTISVITGGPGTGKTTVVADLLRALARYARSRDLVLRVALCAPTAKAYVRVREAIDSTLAAHGDSLASFDDVIKIDEYSGSVHRLLRIRPDDALAHRTLTHDLVVVDEVSMLEFTLLAQLLESVDGGHVVLVGDPDQLTSVNVGAALRDVVDAHERGALHSIVTRLTHNYRSDDSIVQLAAAINAGDEDAVLRALELGTSGVQWHERPEGASDLVLEHVDYLAAAARSADEHLALNALRRVVVLCATRRGPGSVEWWREKIDAHLGQPEHPRWRFRLGAPVLVTRNERAGAPGTHQRLNNGDVGVVVARNGEPFVIFPGTPEILVRPLRAIDEAETAWSMTIHKSQGSEYDCVVVSLPDARSPLLTRELLYTAVTRARTRIELVGSRDALSRALQRRVHRVSGLADRLAALADASPTTNS